MMMNDDEHGSSSIATWLVALSTMVYSNKTSPEFKWKHPQAHTVANTVVNPEKVVLKSRKNMTHPNQVA